MASVTARMPRGCRRAGTARGVAPADAAAERPPQGRRQGLSRNDPTPPTSISRPHSRARTPIPARLKIPRPGAGDPLLGGGCGNTAGPGGGWSHTRRRPPRPEARRDRSPGPARPRPPGLAQGQGAGLVEKAPRPPGPPPPGGGPPLTRMHPAGGPGHGGHGGRGRGHEQGARAPGHQHGHGPVHIPGPPPGQPGAAQDHRREPSGVGIDHPGGPGLARLGLGHWAHPPCPGWCPIPPGWPPSRLPRCS
jgi:translation initiation factor IF-2